MPHRIAADQMGCRARGSKPKRAMAWPRPAPTVRNLVRRGAGGRDQRPRSDGAGDRRRARPAARPDGAAEGPWARRLHFLHQRAERQGRTAGRKPASVACFSTGNRFAARSASMAWSSGSPTPRPMIIGRPARGIRNSAPGHPTSRAHSTAGRRSKRVSRRRSANSRTRTFRVLHIGAATAWFPVGSSSGAIVRIASMSGACSGLRATAGPKGCSTHDRQRDHTGERARLTQGAAFASIAMAVTLIALKTWAALPDRFDGDARLACRQRP